MTASPLILMAVALLALHGPARGHEFIVAVTAEGAGALRIVSEGRRVETPAKLAETEEARLAGFQCATPDEIRTTVIVFEFHREVLGEFRMQNVPSALDIAFVKASGRIFAILRMDPSPTARYGPLGAYRYAIEARAGFFTAHGIAQDDRVVAVERPR